MLQVSWIKVYQNPNSLLSHARQPMTDSLELVPVLLASAVLVVVLDYARQLAFVKFVGTHAQYDAVDVERIDEH
jgi:mRNA-degrading endonuclease HigB of HigAB toxin-antitoxin module